MLAKLFTDWLSLASKRSVSGVPGASLAKEAAREPKATRGALAVDGSDEDEQRQEADGEDEKAHMPTVSAEC